MDFFHEALYYIYIIIKVKRRKQTKLLYHINSNFNPT